MSFKRSSELDRHRRDAHGDSAVPSRYTETFECEKCGFTTPYPKGGRNSMPYLDKKNFAVKIWSFNSISVHFTVTTAFNGILFSLKWSLIDQTFTFKSDSERL